MKTFEIFKRNGFICCESNYTTLYDVIKSLKTLNEKLPYKKFEKIVKDIVVSIPRTDSYSTTNKIIMMLESRILNSNKREARKYLDTIFEQTTSTEYLDGKGFSTRYFKIGE